MKVETVGGQQQRGIDQADNRQTKLLHHHQRTIETQPPQRFERHESKEQSDREIELDVGGQVHRQRAGFVPRSEIEHRG
jgi:hypothetical protein